MQILQVKNAEDFNQSVVPPGKLLVWLEMHDSKATFHCKDENDNVQKISSNANKNCISLSPHAIAMGLDNISGGYAARIEAIDDISQTVTLVSYDDYELLPEKFIIGKTAYIAHNPLNNLDIFTATITAVNPVIENEIVTQVILTVTPDPDQVIPIIDEDLPGILIVNDPESDVTTQAEGQGNIVSGESAGSNGSYNLTVGLCSHSFGVGNTLIGDINLVVGNGNIGDGTSLSILGTSNKGKGTFNHINGSQNNFDGDLLLINGDLNDITADGAGVYGNNNKIIMRTRIADDGSTITERPRQVYIAGIMNEVNADYTHTHGYRLTNRAKHAVVFGRDTYLDDSPENEAAFIIGGGELNNPRNALEVRSRRKIVNPLYNPVNDPDGNGVDFDGEKQYINQLGFMTKYLGHMLGASKTQAVNNDSATALSVSLDHDYYARWKITPTGTGQITFACDYWEDGDEGTLIIYNGNGKIAFPAEWIWIGTQPTLSSDGYDVFTIEKIDNDIIIKHEVSK